MKYVREKDGKIEIMEDGASIAAGAETIFSTDPEVYEGTWDKPAKYVAGAEAVDEGKLGGQKSEAEKKLKAHMRGRTKADRPYWTEPHKAHPQDKVCLNCGKPMPGVRPNKKFCSDKCRKDYSQKGRRAEKRSIRDFHPHLGKEGQIYYLLDGKVGFIPALWCDTQKRTEKYVKDNMPTEVQEEVLKQIRKVYGK